VDFAFTPEQEELRTQARAFLSAHPDPSWQELAELGWTGVSIAEADGGAGLGFLEEAILFEEMGRALTHAPYWSTVAVMLPALPAELQAEVAHGDPDRHHRRRLDLGARRSRAGGAADERRDAAPRGRVRR